VHMAKLAGQAATGGILVATGVQLNSIPLPAGRTFLPTSAQSTVLTILIVVATIKAVDFIGALAARCFVCAGRPGRG